MVVLLALTFAIAPAPQQNSIGFPSTYAPEWRGAKAAYLLLGDLGYRVERWEKPPEDLPENPAGAVFVLVEPHEDSTAGEAAAIRRFISNGGRVLAVGAEAADFLPDFDAAGADEYDPQTKTFAALLPSAITRDAPEISMVVSGRLHFERPFVAGALRKRRRDRRADVPRRERAGDLVGVGIAADERNDPGQEKSGLFSELHRAARAPRACIGTSIFTGRALRCFPISRAGRCHGRGCKSGSLSLP